MRDEIDLGGRGLGNVLQHLPPSLGHDHQPRRARDQFLHHASLLGVGLEQDGVERGDNGHPQFAQQRQQVAPGRSAEDPELVLHADDVDIADVEKVRRALIGR